MILEVERYEEYKNRVKTRYKGIEIQKSFERRDHFDDKRRKQDGQ